MNFGNVIIEIPAARNREKKIVAIVAMPLPKMGEKKKKIVVAAIWGGIKKKKCYVHNIFTTFSQQITGD